MEYVVFGHTGPGGWADYNMASEDEAKAFARAFRKVHGRSARARKLTDSMKAEYRRVWENCVEAGSSADWAHKAGVIAMMQEAR